MPLIKSILEDNIKSFVDSQSSLFTSTPKDVEDNANKWADAISLYAQNIIPVVTPASLIIARTSFINIMKGLSEPVVDENTSNPFTIYYSSPESKLYRFNSYLRDKVGYRSNPSLDKTTVFTILNKIRVEYNNLFPVYALTEDDILYNQNRFNQIYSEEINIGKIIPLMEDGVTTKTTELKYKFIPVDKKGRVIRLQNDGIIGDDTIRYLPIINYSIYGQTGNAVWNSKYSSVKFITQPSSSGEVFLNIPLKRKDGNFDTQKRASTVAFKRDIIDKGISKDYSIIRVDRTQSDIDGGLSPGTSVSKFINDFEINHSTCNPIWIKNKIKTIDQYITFKQLKVKTYNNLPTIQKDGFQVLENAIKAYAVQLGIGMNPSFTGSPSPAPINLSSVSAIGMAGGTASDCVEFISNLIDIYFKSGTATNNSSGATTTWQ